MELDLHVHSCYSYDSLLRPETILRRAKAMGLTGVAITDHGTIQGALRAHRVNRDEEFTVIVGCEILTDIGDILGLFLHDEIRSTSFPEVIDEIRSQDGLVVLPHPFRGHTLSDVVIRSIDAVEVFNARASETQNVQSQEMARRYSLPASAGSDAHTAAEIGLGRIVLHDDPDIRKALMDGKGWGTGSRSPRYAHYASRLIKAVKLRRLPVSQAAGTV
ncbi:MAG: PHP domain-containing protein [Methanomicrobiales archaeon]|nr:PHP domain-containing protein [Methanomicrobiales archaeon]MDI6877171.1 PHP domain-containing protein [Methanomicrobiales archaeon]